MLTEKKLEKEIESCHSSLESRESRKAETITNLVHGLVAWWRFLATMEASHGQDTPIVGL